MSFNSGSSNPRRREYQSLDPPVSEDEWSSTELKKIPGMPRMKSRDAMKDSSLDDLLSSGDESDSHDGANVKLLPLDKNAQRKKKGKQVQFTPDTSSASPDAIDGPGEPRDVSKAIENMLSRERDILSETFDEDLDHASKYVFDDEDSDEYGIPTHKNQGGTGYGDGRRRSWASGIKSLLHITAWWHVFPLIAVGLLVMWLATKGLPWVLGGKKQKEYSSIPWYPTPLGGTNGAWKESYSKAHDLVERMELVEKVNITTGTGWRMGLCVGNTGPAMNVKFPSLCLQDGPLGLRFADNITAFPAGITTGATWNRELMQQRGFALGQEARAKGVNILLGPSMGPLGMMPAGGRNWEGFGSDPVLQGVAAAETIRGIQRNGVMATAKHWLMNEQEHFRQVGEWDSENAISSNVDDRTLHEVFAWPFAESVRADVASVMCSYQKVNNSFACENSKLLNGILKDELGFQGFVQSDWLAQRSGVQSALSGLDMSMPGDGAKWEDGDSFWGQRLTQAALNTSVPMERLNDMVTRVVAAWYHFRQDSWDQPPPLGKGGPNFSSWTYEKMGSLHPGSKDDQSNEVVNHYVNAQETGSKELSHSLLARKVAAEGIVLLKNVNNTLPLSRTASGPTERYRVGIYGEDAGPGEGPNVCGDRGCNQGTLGSGWGSGAVDFPYLVTPWDALRAAWPSEKSDVRGFFGRDVAMKNLVDQDLCLVFANSDGGEGFIHDGDVFGDRNNLDLQHGGAKLIERVATNCGGGQGKTVVVIHSVGPVVMESWIDLPGVHAVLYANLPGQESGNALVDVLFGDVDASGRLPYTIGRSLDDYGPGAKVMYSTRDRQPEMMFDQGLYIDYRYFDKKQIAPRFEFGFGLSYTTFNISSLTIKPLREKSRLPAARPKNEIDPPKYDNKPPAETSTRFPPGFNALAKYIYPYTRDSSATKPGSYPYPDGYKTHQHLSEAGGGPGGNPSLYDEMVSLSVNVSNTGPRSGKEVVQVYLSFPEHVAEHRGLGQSRENIEFPDRVLRNFTKVSLEPGEHTTVQMTLSRKDLSYWSVRAQNWVMPTEGTFRIWAGRSSRDLPLIAEF
ncbi:putative beta-glucosidase E [Penicillium oxalicum]|uniref:putative beta-glucosidase E n=1 Tax=Penicillium oxalicum TaxID=69781 RepID=UPI0020B69585|nr:putative beta-glucosidase E [Penicillium oxalicum]KAI2787261.1 putative beta-glucosidase E [Penicillium oxalicum]